MWDQFIMDEVWNRKFGRDQLGRRLSWRWMNNECNLEKVGTIRKTGATSSLFYNDRHFFFVRDDDELAVHSLDTGEHIRDLGETLSPDMKQT